MLHRQFYSKLELQFHYLDSVSGDEGNHLHSVFVSPSLLALYDRGWSLKRSGICGDGEDHGLMGSKIVEVKKEAR